MRRIESMFWYTLFVCAVILVMGRLCMLLRDVFGLMFLEPVCAVLPYVAVVAGSVAGILLVIYAYMIHIMKVIDE
jgi:hypothetical protein